MEIQDPVALVTGGASDLGEACARLPFHGLCMAPSNLFSQKGQHFPVLRGS